MKNLFVLFVLFFTTQLLAGEMVNTTKFETTIEAQFFDVDVINLKADCLSDRTPKRGYNYKKQAKKKNRKKLITRLFNTDNCNYYRRNGHV